MSNKEIIIKDSRDFYLNKKEFNGLLCHRISKTLTGKVEIKIMVFKKYTQELLSQIKD